MAFTSSRRKQRSNISYISSKIRCNIINSHINSSESNNPDTSNSDNVIGNPNFPHINVQNDSTFNTLFILPKKNRYIVKC